MNNWTPIFVTSQLYRAEIIKGMLCDNGIEAIIMNQKDSSFEIGDVTVMVNNEEKEKAAEIIKSLNCE